MIDTPITFDQARVTEQVYSFVVSCANAMMLCAETRVQQEMLARLSGQIGKKQSRSFSANPLPVLRNLQWVKDMKLAKDFRRFAPYLPWRVSPRTDDQGHQVAIMDFDPIFDMGDIVLGLMYVDARQNYPEHNHAGQEMYFLISGTAEWRYGGHDDYQRLSAGNVIYNYPWDWHGVKAGDTPLLALYLLA